MEKVYTNLTTGGPISVYVEDGKITRIRPLQVPEEDYPKPWTVEDKTGKVYSPPKAMRVAQNIIRALKARFEAIARVECRVTKLAPPLGGKVARVSVTLCEEY